MPYSPPAEPVIATSRTISGAAVSVSARAGSATRRSQTFSPVALLIANRRPSSEIEITLSFHSATPRLLLTPQQATSPAQGLVGLGVKLPAEHALLAAGDVDRIDRAPPIGDAEQDAG